MSNFEDFSIMAFFLLKKPDFLVYGSGGLVSLDVPQICKNSFKSIFANMVKMCPIGQGSKTHLRFFSDLVRPYFCIYQGNHGLFFSVFMEQPFRIYAIITKFRSVFIFVFTYLSIITFRQNFRIYSPCSYFHHFCIYIITMVILNTIIFRLSLFFSVIY